MVGKLNGTTCAGCSASVGSRATYGSQSTLPARTASARSHWRKISMVRVLMPVARGIVEVPARRSTTSTCAPCRSAATAVARPAGPAPTTSTSVLADGVELGVMRSGSPAAGHRGNP